MPNTTNTTANSLFETVSFSTASEPFFYLFFIYAVMVFMIVAGQKSEMMNAFAVLFGIIGSLFIIAFMGMQFIFYVPLMMLTVYAVSREFS